MTSRTGGLEEDAMHIYIDFDDCLCETARAFTGMVRRLFGKEVPYEDVRFFNLQQSFGLTDGQYAQIMTEGHLPEALLALEETPGASEVVSGWMDRGHEVSVVTGRPAAAYEPSREWLDRHHLERAGLFCLNKYGRDSFIRGSSFNLEMEDFFRMKFEFAVEDSPMAFQHLAHLPELPVMVFDRPWNRDCVFPGSSYQRCGNWAEIDRVFLQKLSARESCHY